MTIPEEIEEIKTQLTQTTDEQAEAELILELLKKYASVNSTDGKPYIERLLNLAEKILNESGRYQAYGLYYFAFIKRVTGEYDVALNSAQQALSQFERIEDKRGLGMCCNNIGIIHSSQGNYPEAMKNHLRALQINESINDMEGIASSLNSVGSINLNQGDYPGAMKNHLRALQISESINDMKGIASSVGGIGNINIHQGDCPGAMKNHLRALQIMEAIDDNPGIASSHTNIGHIHWLQEHYVEALKHHLRALQIMLAIDDKRGIAGSYNSIGLIHLSQLNYSEALKNFLSTLQIMEEIGDKQGIAVLYNNIGGVYDGQKDYTEAIKNKLLALQTALEIGAKNIIRRVFGSLFSTYKATNDFENALKYYEKYHEIDDEILGKQVQTQLSNLTFQKDMELKEKELEIQHLRNVELKQEKDRSETLLLNILPAEVAEELKAKGFADAKHFNDVTVLYTDFVGFTTVSEQLTPQQLVNELHTCFKAFDEITSKYNIEKIKTVGDAYLAVCGLPLANENHAENIIKAAIEIKEFMLNRRKELGGKTFEIRIGVNSGSVVAGIVGVKKYAYDIWGDTVNTAARMEQNSEPGKINISEATYELVKDKFKFEYRGEIEAKNKGKMRMYFVAKP